MNAQYPIAPAASTLGTPAGATVAADDTVPAGGGYADPTGTPGPAAALAASTTRALCFTAVTCYKAGSGETLSVAPAVSGATTIAASDAAAASASMDSGASGGMMAIRGWLTTGLVAGANTFTLKYKSTGGSFHVLRRWVVAWSF